MLAIGDKVFSTRFSFLNTYRQKTKFSYNLCLVLQLHWSDRPEIIQPDESLQTQRSLIFLFVCLPNILLWQN